MKKTIIRLVATAILLSMVLMREVSASPPPESDFKYQYSSPEDFIQWINNSATAKTEKKYQQYINAYKKKQDFILAPKMEAAILDKVCWGNRNISINYHFFKNDIDWFMYIYPTKAYNTENFPNTIDSLIKDKYSTVINKTDLYPYSVTDEVTGETYTQTFSYEKKKLQLGNRRIVDCVQQTVRRKNEKRILERVYLECFISDMYVYISSDEFAVGKAQKLIQAMKKCTFQKIYTVPQPKLYKKKSKVSRKNAIVYAILRNPTRRGYTELRFYLYDKKGNKHKVLYQESIKKRYRRRRKVVIKLDVRQCLKRAKRQMKAKKVYLLKRKKKYRYKIQVKVGAKYYDATGSFRLR